MQTKGSGLRAIFHPKNIAVIGATEKEGSVGRTLFNNLTSGTFTGKVFPINPKRETVLGAKAYPSVLDVEDDIDLAVIVIPSKFVPATIKECVKKKIKGAIIISAGFKEIGEEGVKLEQEVLDEARKGGMRIIGPNCLGVMNPFKGMNATFASVMANPGNVAFISQSGALCTSVLDWSFTENVGFSSFVSIGSMLDIGWGDLIDYFGDDPRTQSIVIYMESIGDARSFLSAAREVSLKKPIIVIKVGRTQAAAEAASSHTGSMTGKDEVLDAAFRRCGVVRVQSVAELFYMAEVLAKQPRPKGPKLSILTNAGGPGVLATDALIQYGGSLGTVSKKSMDELNAFLPEHWSKSNPVDILGDADPDRFMKSFEILAEDEENDGVLVVLTPQAMTDPSRTADLLKAKGNIEGKPVLASWMGGDEVAPGKRILNRAGLPTFDYPDTAARIFNYMWQYSYNLRGIYETPTVSEDHDNHDNYKTVSKVLDKVVAGNRTLLSEFESKEVLKAYGLPVVETIVCPDEESAVKAADDMGYPVVLKLNSETVTHKTDVDGVKLNLNCSNEVRKAYKEIQKGCTEKAGAEHFQGVSVQPMINNKGFEIIMGSSTDPQFGPVLLFGAGGQMVEIFQDFSLALPPLNTTLARRMMEQTSIYKALHGFRGAKAVDMEALEQLCVHFSQLVAENTMIKEVDMNPVLVSGERIIVLDARIELFTKEELKEGTPRLAIRPYPHQYVFPYKLKNEESITIRPIRPEDEPDVISFHKHLSDQTVFYRYLQKLQLKKRISHERMTRICFIDYDREMALVADRKNPETGKHEIIGVTRFIKFHGTSEAGFVIIVRDECQNLGLGSILMKKLLMVAKREGVTKLIGEIHTENQAMMQLCLKNGFVLSDFEEELLITAEKEI